MFTVNINYGFSAVNTIGLTPEGPRFGPPGYEINLLYIAGLVALVENPLVWLGVLAVADETRTFRPHEDADFATHHER